jgi:hypothetical protein
MAGRWREFNRSVTAGSSMPAAWAISIEAAAPPIPGAFAVEAG